MTAIIYPDCQASSPNGRFTLEARSPHNGTIAHKDGRQPSEDDFAFKYREHQSEFRYCLLDNSPAHPLRRMLLGAAPRVVWERWQQKREDSPHQVLVSDDGWSVLRTHGFRPELIVVSPRGADVFRVRVAWPDCEQPAALSGTTTPVFLWDIDIVAFSTAGIYWAEDSWPYFFQRGDSPHFAWRTARGQRVVIDMGNGKLVPSPALEIALNEEEKRGALALLAWMSPRMADVRRLLALREGERDIDQGLNERLPFVRAALLLASFYRLEAAVPYLREWEPIDRPSHSQGTTAMPDAWRETQLFRPVVHHALRLLGEEPAGFATYYFTATVVDSRKRIPMPECLLDRRSKAARLTQEMAAEEVLALLGSPDHIRRKLVGEKPPYRSTEHWEYDFLGEGRWTTLGVTWEEAGARGRIQRVDNVGAYWLQSGEREAEFLSI